MFVMTEPQTEETREIKKKAEMKTVAELNDKHFLITGSQKSTLCKVVQCIIDMRVAVHQN